MHNVRHHRMRALALVPVTLAATALIAGCGGGSTSTASGNGIDRAFAQQMSAHHQSAVAMARIAQQRTRRAQITTLAGNIVASQSRELMKLKSADAALTKDKVAAGDLGIAQHAMGMDMNDNALLTAKPFDRAFIDMMVPHHQGAIRMARVELAKGKSASLKTLARQIIAAQSREIGQMNRWRTTWYGAASPSGGVPAGGMSHPGMDMSGA